MTEENKVEETMAEDTESPAPAAEQAVAEAEAPVAAAEEAPVKTDAAAAETAEAAEPAAKPGRGRRQMLQGLVVSDKMDKTIIVSVTSTVMHPLYQRYIKRSAKFYAHDEANECQLGDEVSIVATRPLSKTKRWRVREVLKRAE